MNKLNLGCGLFKKEGYVNVDFEDRVNPDIVLDLNNLEGYKRFEDEEFDEINMSHVLEHLNNPFDIMKELHRILKPNGLLIIEVPHFSRGFSHSQHARGFDVTFPYYYDHRFSGGYYGINFDLVDMRLSWMTQFELKRQVVSNPIIFYVSKFINKLITFLANLSPYLCSRIWCFWVGGFEEIKFVFSKPADS